MIHYETLLQNATVIITKCDSYFIRKCDRRLQNASGFLLQNVSFITKCDDITNYGDFIIKCGSYNKMRRLLQITTVQTVRLILHSFFVKLSEN